MAQLLIQAQNKKQLQPLLDLRYQVFCIEQKVSVDEEIDHFDIIDNEIVKHYGFYVNGSLVGVCRLLLASNKIKIGRVCISKTFRSKNYGLKMLTAVLFENPLLTNQVYYLEAQIHALSFYQKLDFKAYGDIFLDANIKHLKMQRTTKLLSPFCYSNTNKRYHTLDYHFKKKFNSKIARIAINAGFTCPNIDGTKSYGGCTFCSINGSGDYAGLASDHLLTQFENQKSKVLIKWPKAQFIAYFQAFSNTYAPLEVLKSKYQNFVDHKECIGIAISTRADCLDDEIIDYLAQLHKQTYLIVEIGLQSIHQTTAKLINRAHSLAEFDLAISKLRAHNINVVVHIINGLAKETKKMMLDTAKYLAKKDIQGVKIHLLHVINHTPLVNQLNNNFLTLLTKQQYIEIVAEQLQFFNENVIIHRITGDAPSEDFIGPLWSRDKTDVLNSIDKFLVQHQIIQGAKYEEI